MSYQAPRLPTGGELYADVTNGYGPECFAIDGTPKAGPYQLSIHYYAQGPMGYGMGLVQVARVRRSPPHARVDLGSVR